MRTLFMQKKNRKVKLKSFNGKLFGIKDIEPNENYWILIGELGEIIEDNSEERVLVLFDNNLDNLNLINHNPIKNSLWILKNDLEFVIT